MNLSEFKSRKELADELNIHFIRSVQPEHFPETHRRLFEDVQKLGRQLYGEYRQSITVDSIDKPWREQTKRRAERLTILAETCRNLRKNEPSWRFTIEPEVLHRFAVEVDCPRCRRKLWQSEIAAAVQDSEIFARGLEERRKRRMACNCPGRLGYYDFGVNMIFSDRAEAVIQHEFRISPQKKNKEEKPDRVYGLSWTRNFRTLLNSIDKRTLDGDQKTLKNTLNISPFPKEVEPLLYPFLMLEAKSDKQGDTAAVELQTAFCLRRLLKIQHELRYAAGEDTVWETGPLVWLLTWYGDHWYVSGGFVKGPDENLEYTAVELWNGSIHSEDGALQLLLIVDYIVDWARDVFRKSILNELNALATEDITERDSDVFSTTLRDVSEWVQDNLDHDSLPNLDIPNTVQPETEIQFLNLVTTHGVVRDASVIESRLLALHLTEDDVETFLISFSSVQTSREGVADILICMNDSWYLSAETLTAMEATWTGYSRPFADTSEPMEMFHVKFCFSMFITSEWQPVRQITCLAISETALRKLLVFLIPDSEAEIPSLWMENSAQPATLTKTNIEHLLHQLMRQTVIGNLSGAVSMLCLTGVFLHRAAKLDFRFPLKGSKAFGFKKDSKPLVIELVSTIYNAHKIGQRLPQDQYLRFSKLVSRTNSNANPPKWLQWHSAESFSPHTNRCVLVDGLHDIAEIPQYCLYFMERTYSASDTPGLVRKLARKGFYYSTLPLLPSMHPNDYFKYLNRLDMEDALWKAKGNREKIQSWITDLKAYRHREIMGNNPGASSSQPFLIVSSDEESYIEDVEGDAIMSVE